MEKVKVEFEVSYFHAEMLKALARLTASTANGVAKDLIEAILDDDVADDACAVRTLVAVSAEHESTLAGDRPTADIKQRQAVL